MVNVKLFCDQLSKDLEMGDNPIEEEGPGIFSLPIEENVAIKIGTFQEGFTLNCILAALPGNATNLLTEVMNANLYGFITRDNVLGLTNDGNQLTLSRTIDYNVSYERFNEVLQDFYNMTLFWRDMVLNNLNTVK
jgi:hypothetical protein